MNLKMVQERLIVARGNTPRAEVAKNLGISVSALSMCENGDRMPRDEIKERIAAFYGTTVGALFFGEEVHDSQTSRKKGM